MSNQVFKQIIPDVILFDFLKKNCHEKTKCYYIVNKSSYKKADMNKSLIELCNTIKPYYHTSKMNYIVRSLNYNNFLTLIRQICNCNKISYESNIKYDRSNYEIYYYIYFQ
jgi:hypothetical protein